MPKKAKEEPKNGPGKPRAIKSAEHFGELIDAFIEYIDERMDKDYKAIPDDYMLCKFISEAIKAKFSIGTLYDYRENRDNRYSGYPEQYKKLESFREHFYQAVTLANPKLAGSSAFALKQAKNGGWTDKQTVEVPEIKIKIAGGGDLHDIGQ